VLCSLHAQETSPLYTSSVVKECREHGFSPRLQLLAKVRMFLCTCACVVVHVWTRMTASDHAQRALLDAAGPQANLRNVSVSQFVHVACVKSDCARDARC
jgi:hypothetical protein